MKSRTMTCITGVTLFVALVLPGQLAAQEQKKGPPRYTITDLGTLGGTFSSAVGINNRGVISGDSTLSGDLVMHAFIWQKGVMTDLGTLGGPNSFAPEEWPPSARDEVVGFSDTHTLDPYAENFCGPFSFITSPYICLPFVRRHGVLTTLPTLGGNNGAAVAINNRGQLAGIAETTTVDSSCLPPQVFDFSAVIWGPEGDIQKLAPLPGDNEGAPTGINDNGQVVGTSANCAFGPMPIRAVLWQDGKPINLGSLGGMVLNIAFGINNRGQVVGGSDLAGDITGHAFLWQKGVMSDLGTLPGDVGSNALSINNGTQIVGVSFDASGNMRPVLWQNSEIFDLNDLIPGDSPLFLLEALGINDVGQIVGYGVQIATGEVHAYVASPNHGSNDDDLAVRVGERPKIVLPENVLKMLQQRPSFGRFMSASHSPEVKAAGTSAPAVTLSPTTLNFGTIAIGSTSAAKAVVLKNTGTASLTIRRIVISGANPSDFAQTHNCGSSLAAGASCSISATFKPTANGTRTAALSIIDNAAGSPQKVTLSGVGTTAKVMPVRLSFGAVVIDKTSPPQTVTMTNVGSSTITITSIAIVGADSGDFGETKTCGSSLVAHASCSISVRFRPTASGTRTAVLKITDSAAGSPQAVSLSGNGSAGRCLPLGSECPPQFPPCCPGLVCVPASTRAFCEPAGVSKINSGTMGVDDIKF